jgi:TolB-like protein
MLRAWLIWFCGLLGSATIALGQTAPAITIGDSPRSGERSNRVLLTLPIAAPGSGEYAAAGQSIQQDLVADLTSLTAARVIAPASARPATDEQSALEQGRQNGAEFVVWGQAQVSGNQMRVTGQLLDVGSGRPLAGLKATAPADNLFPLEDSLAAQIARALPAPLGLVTPAPQTQPAPEGVESVPTSAPIAAPAADSGNPYYSYTATVPQTYYTYNTYYYPGYWSPYWGYPYPYVWGGIGFYGGFWPHHYGWYGGYPYGHYGFHGGYGGGFRGGYGGGFHGGAHGGGFGGHGGGGGHR